jgi:hypothetical protein
MYSNPLLLINKFITKNVLLLTEELLNSFSYSAKITIFKVKTGSDINLKKSDKLTLLMLLQNN